MNKKIKVGIVGLGLIGASLLKALANKVDYEIYCVSSSSFEKALSFCDKASDDIKILNKCEIVFVCSTIQKTPEVLDKLDNIVSSKTVVADVSSTKSNLKSRKYNFNFILSHPMAGSHLSGFDASKDDLFKGAKWLIEKNNNLLEKIIVDVGATPFVFDMKYHDKYCAQISHLPTIISFLLFDIASDNAKEIASSGFRDTTRLAMTNFGLVLDMLKNNFENIEQMFHLLNKRFNDLKNYSDDEKIKLFSAISQKRAQMYDSYGKNIFKI